MSTSDTLLALLEREPAHGYTLKQRHDELFGRKRPLAYGQVYATLARFERRGLAVTLDPEAGGGPDRRRYLITPDGVRSIDHWLATPQEADVFATSSLYARITVALLSGRPAGEVLDAQREVHLVRMRELQAERRTASGAALLAVTYELAHLDADLRWIDDAAHRLPDLRLDGAQR